jgi:DNA mismatch repair protein MutL
MSKINILSDELINKIAAGEVVERPASIVKELMENAIDAGATRISITVKEGGISLIKVEDNGYGMDKVDARLAIKRHATSKLKNTKDLFMINTLGFRGEALASISAVSKLTLQTKTKENELGYQIKVEGNTVTEEKEVACNQGTSIIVEDLFYNVPARKKHLKTMSTEFRMIVDVITRYALLYKDLDITLTHNEKRVLHAPKTTNTLSNIISIYGKKLAEQLISVDWYQHGTHISGYISRPTAVRNDRAMQTLFINRRLVKNYTLKTAVYKGYQTALHINKHPIFILNIEVPPEKIDVNVHPQKTEIRIQKEGELFGAIMSAIRFTLETQQEVPEVVEAKQEQQMALRRFEVTHERQTVLEPNVIEEKINNQVTEKVSKLRLIGRIHNLFYLAENELGLMIIDQHAAHERVMYEKIKAQKDAGAIKKQELIQPEMLEVTATESITIQENKETLEKFGFLVEEFGTNTFMLRTVPFILGRQLKKEVFFDVIGALGDLQTKVEEQKEDKLMRTACRAAVKANDVVEISEMYNIMKALQSCENPFTCPHGRPTMIQFSIPELEKQFMRIV